MKRAIILAMVVGLALWATTLDAAHSDHGCKNCHVTHNAGDPADPDIYGVPLYSLAQLGDGIPVYTLYDRRPEAVSPCLLRL